MVFYILLYFYFIVTFLVKIIIFFALPMGVTHDQYRPCIGLFNNFRVIKCRAYLWTRFFSLLLEISYVFYLTIF